MDIYEYLKMDHDKVAKLFKQYKNAKSSPRKKQIITMIIDELFVHAQSEQNTFYKILENHPESQEDAEHGKKEHKEIYDQMNLITNSKKSDTHFNKKVEKLEEIVNHHVREEEGPIFRRAKKILSEEEAYAVKERMHNYKHKLIMRKKIDLH